MRTDKNQLTVTFFSNFLLLHQTPFCEAMVRLLGDGFHFVATERIPEERLIMGYEDMSHSAAYAVNSYESEESYQKAIELGKNSDVVIIGSAPDIFIEERLSHNKLTFRYYERYFKEGRWRILDPRVFLSHYKTDMRYRNKPLYMLCASAYTAPDCHFIGCYKGKTYKWGYFPEVKHYNETELMAKKKHEKVSILWVGRLIPLKHPEYPIILADLLSKKGYDFTLTMIGQGEMRESLDHQVQKRGLSNIVTFNNFLPQSDVRKHMEASNIFLFTSNRLEGWGAVLNESMNSGCAVVANDEIGSVPFLIQNGVNGLKYHHTVGDLISKVETILQNVGMAERLGLEAYRTMRDMWNADNGAERLVRLFDGMLNGRTVEFEYGPVSLAQ